MNQTMLDEVRKAGYEQGRRDEVARHSGLREEAFLALGDLGELITIVDSQAHAGGGRENDTTKGPRKDLSRLRTALEDLGEELDPLKRMQRDREFPEVRDWTSNQPAWMKHARHIHEYVVSRVDDLNKNWEPWSKEDVRFLSLALCGETGEVANVVKKEWRGDDDALFLEHLIEELVDSRIYLELIAMAHSIDLDAACMSLIRNKLYTRWPGALVGAPEGAQ